MSTYPHIHITLSEMKLGEEITRSIHAKYLYEVGAKKFPDKKFTFEDLEEKSYSFKITRTK